MGRFLLILLLLAVGYLGFSAGSPKEEKRSSLNVHPEKTLPLTEYKSFAVVVYAHNDAVWCKKSLRSIFEQDYENYRVFFVDDASLDQTIEKARDYIIETHQDQRVILLRNERFIGKVGSLYRSIENLLDKEIVVFLEAKDFFSHSKALSEMNEAYQNEDVWITFASTIDYPSYTIHREKSPSFDPSISFYAALFKQIQLPDLLVQGSFSTSVASFLNPLVDLSGGRIRKINEPLLFRNRAVARYQFSKMSSNPYHPLASFPKPHIQDDKCDLLLFSFDRPLQLYSCLESIFRYMTGFEKISVIYRSSNQRFNESYEVVKKSFPEVDFIAQSETTPKRDFKPNVMKTIFDSPSKFIMLGVDDLIVKDFVDLKFCMEMMEKTGAYGFYLRFGHNIRFCYQSKLPQNIPKSIPLSEKIYAWDIYTAEHDWAFPNSVDMTIFRKKDLKEPFKKMKFKTPNSLEYIWATEHPPKRALGLYFDSSKVVNLPLNVVGKTGNPHMNFLTTKDLLVKFEEGMKIDIDPLYRIENISPHFEYAPEFVAR